MNGPVVASQIGDAERAGRIATWLEGIKAYAEAR